MTTSEYDNRTRRCPRLGHEVPFSYCRAPAQPEPCGKILDCWWESFDVRGFVERAYGPETLAPLQAPPQPKVASIVDLIRQARERTARKGS